MTIATYPELKPVGINFEFPVNNAEALADAIVLHNQPDSSKLRAVRVRHNGGNTIIISETGYKTSSVAVIVGTLENLRGNDSWEVYVPADVLEQLGENPNPQFLTQVNLAISSLQESNQ